MTLSLIEPLVVNPTDRPTSTPKMTRRRIRLCLRLLLLLLSGARALLTLRTTPLSCNSVIHPHRRSGSIVLMATPKNEPTVQTAYGALRLATGAASGVARRGLDQPVPWLLAAVVAAWTRSLGWLAWSSAVVAIGQCIDHDARRRVVANWRRCSRAELLLTRPLTAAFVGWLTNYVGVQMLFYPLDYRGLTLVERKPCSKLGDMPSFGWFGWQGIVPAKAPRMARDLVRVVTKLVSVEGALSKLEPRKVADCVHVGRLARATVGRGSALEGAGLAVWEGLTEETKQRCSARGRALALGLAKDVRKHGAVGLDLETLCVSALSGANVAKLVDLFQRVGRVELRLLVNSGIVVGLALGYVQSLVSLALSPKYGGADQDKGENPVVGLIGAAIVGAVTNWIALLWIFKPIEPLRFLGGFELQGCFLRRQAEVATDFAAFFVSNILTAKNLLVDLFQGPKAHNFLFPYVRHRLEAFASGIAANALPPSFRSIAQDDALLDSATNAIAAQLPANLPDRLFRYADTALDLKTQIGTKMRAMPARDFERLLHPIFEEDEATLIAVGGVLGFAAAALQGKFAGMLSARRGKRNHRRPSSAEADERESTPSGDKEARQATSEDEQSSSSS